MVEEANRLTPMARRTGVLTAALASVLWVVAAGARESNGAEAKAYRILEVTRHLPPLDRGDAERAIAGPWPPPRRRPTDPLIVDREARRQLHEAVCDADLVVLGRVESGAPVQHPNGRWILTVHDVAVAQVVRARKAEAPAPSRLRYVHPGGQLAIAGRVVTTTVDGFPPLATDEDLLFFLVRVGRGPLYRTSMRVPPLAIGAGALRDPAPSSPDRRRLALDGTNASAALRAIGATDCRPPKPPANERRPSDEDWPWPEPPL